MKKTIITDFEANDVQYIIDEDLVVNAKLDNKYYNIYIQYLITLNL